MLVFSLALVTALVGVSWFVWYALRGVPRRLDYLETALNELLRRGFDCGFLLIRISYTNKFVQIRKYINSPGVYGIQFAFPKANWSIRYFETVKEVCRGIDPSSYVQDDEGMDFLYVDFGTDVQKAHLCVKRILTEVFGVTQNTKLFVTLENASIRDELINESQMD